MPKDCSKNCKKKNQNEILKEIEMEEKKKQKKYKERMKKKEQKTKGNLEQTKNMQKKEAAKKNLPVTPKREIKIVNVQERIEHEQENDKWIEVGKKKKKLI